MLLENRENLIATLRVDEGVVNKIYLDHLGYPTFGIGHLVVKTDPEYGCPVGTLISAFRVAEVFSEDCDKMVKACKILFKSDWKKLPVEVQEILVNMMFNMGRTRLTKFKKMRAAIHARNWKKAAIEGRDSLWYNQVTSRAERLMTRLENVTD
jgi:GH24 family phage-related lysozyme (muramidase)